MQIALGDPGGRIERRVVAAQRLAEHTGLEALRRVHVRGPVGVDERLLCEVRGTHDEPEQHGGEERGAEAALGEALRWRRATRHPGPGAGFAVRLLPHPALATARGNLPPA